MLFGRLAMETNETPTATSTTTAPAIPSKVRVRTAKAKQIVDRSKRAVKLADGKAKHLTKKPRTPQARERVNCGKKLGLNVGETWCFMFIRNEKETKKLTDTQIRTFMRAEFPGNADGYDYAESLDRVRAKYNNGGFNGLSAQPTLLSVEYDKDGKPVADRPKKKTESPSSPYDEVKKNYDEILKKFKASTSF